MQRRTRLHWLLLLIPYVWDVLLVPWTGTVRIHILNMSFFFVWMLLGIIVTSICVAVVFTIDRRLTAQTAQATQTNR